MSTPPTDFENEHRDGIPWWDAPVHRRWQRHRWQTRGWLGLSRVSRCACGAFERDGRWTRIDPWPDREDRERRRALRRES